MDADTFLSTLRNDVLSPDEYADSSGVREELGKLEAIIAQIENSDEAGTAKLFFATPEGRRIAALLIGAKPEELTSTQRQADFGPLIERWRSWLHRESLSGAIVGLLLAEAHDSRKERRRNKFERVVASAFESAVRNAGVDGLRVQRNATVRGIRVFHFVVFAGTEPVLALADVFQVATGGRQSAVLADLLQTQEALARRRASLVVVADGPGFASMGKVVRNVVPNLRFITNLSGLERGELDLLVRSALKPTIRDDTTSSAEREFSLVKIADVALARGQTVSARLLNIRESEAETFFLRYRADHPDFALVSTTEGLQAESEEAIRSLATDFDAARRGDRISARKIVAGLAERLGAELLVKDDVSTGDIVSLGGLSYPIRMPMPLPVLCLTRPNMLELPSTLDTFEQWLSDTEAPGRLVVVLDPYQRETTADIARGVGISRRIQLAIFNEADVVQVLLRNRPAAKEEFRRALVRRSDLTIVSPYVSEGPTTAGMFFGRAAELRRIAEQIRDHSFALIGGRKAGKTSLLRRLQAHLTPQYKVAYLDCQAHPDREDFLGWIQRQLPEPESLPQGPLAPHAERILRAFVSAKLSSEFGILLADEVDDLFHADATAKEYPHVLSKAFRALAQARSMSLIATGERTLFALTRDPSSPHWNFCTPITIGPLAIADAQQLVREPLHALGIDVVDAAVDSLVESSVRHPNLLQYLGSEIVQGLSAASSRGEALRVDESVVAAHAATPQYRERFINTFWSQATLLEKLLSTELSSTAVRRADEMRERIGTPPAAVSLSQILEALAYLRLYSIAKESEHGFSFAAPAFERYIGIVPETLKIEWRRRLIEASA